MILLASIQLSYAGQGTECDTLQYVYQTLKEQQLELRMLKQRYDDQQKRINSLQAGDALLQNDVDSLKEICRSLSYVQNKDRTMFNGKFDETNGQLQSNRSLLTQRSYIMGAICIMLLLILFIAVYWFTKKFRKSDFSIDEVRKAQIKMQEESIKLDNKLLEIAEQQMKIPATINNQATTAVDHSLALKVADEIVRIELNLSRMDSSIKGYKQLAKAVQRIKDNFQANGYEIVDMLGKPYNEGMKVIANFVSDENMEQGKQIITGIIKPQINYNGKMIQSAQITVSQNI